MKNRIKLLSATIITLVLLSSFAFRPGNVTFKDKDIKKGKVHIVISKNGVKHYIDTTFNDFDPDIIDEKIDSVLEHMEIRLGSLEEMDDIFKGDTIHLKKMEDLEQALAKIDSMTFDINCFTDSLGKGVYIFKGPSGHEHCLKMPLMPPMPPLPPDVPYYKKGKNDRYAFDPDDEDIISYDRKELSKGREKIVIIRKKKEAENENYSY